MGLRRGGVRARPGVGLACPGRREWKRTYSNETNDLSGQMTQIHDILRKDPEIWRLFTSAEEYEDTFRDGYDRFPHYMSSHREPFEPLASHYLVEQGYSPEYPDGQPFAVCLTHDIDLWRKRTLRQLAKEMGKALRRPSRLPAAARAFCRGPDPWSDLDAIAALEDRYDMRSTFFVLPGRPNQVVNGVGVVNSYAARPEAVRETLRRLVARGCEVALHGSFDSWRSAEALAAERRDVAALAGADVAGCRQHFLRLDRPATWQAQAEAGLRYDASLGYHDTDGYRPGLSFPFRPLVSLSLSSSSSSSNPTPIAPQPLPLLELPLAIYDGGLYEWQTLDADAAWERLRGYLERTEADGSMLGLLWHNTHFCDLDAPGYRGVYERALDWIRSHGGWGAPARDIADWWLRRSAQLTTAGR